MSATRHEAAKTDTTPMLDIVFILLIFFIVTAAFVREAGLEVNRPDGLSSSGDKAMAFLIDDNNRISYQSRPIESTSVAAIIKQQSVVWPEAPVVIQTSENTHIGVAIDIYDAALQTGIPRSRIAWTEAR